MAALDEILQAPNLKLGRAKHHINDLNRQIQAYLAQKPLRLMTRGEPQADREVHFVKQVIPPPDFGLVIGDAVHNLRGALDMLMYRMIGDRAKRLESVQFPFAKRAESLKSTMDNRETHLAGEKVVAEIKALKPYVGGNKWLSGLHMLDIADKHKLIIAAASSANMTSLEFSKMLPGVIGREGVELSIHQGAKFDHTFAGPRKARLANRSKIRTGEYERDLQPTFEIIFDEGQPFAGHEVTGILVAMVDEVRTALGKVAGAFTG